MDVNIIIRGQSNALLFAERGGAAILEQGLETQLGVDVHVLSAWDAPASTIHSATAFTDWDTGGQEASLLRFVNGLPADLKDNPTATLWIHNEYDQNTAGLTTNAWLGEVQADAALVRGALGQGAATTPYEFVPIRYPYGGGYDAIKAGMDALAGDGAFNASVTTAALSLAMNGGAEPGINSSHMGDADAVTLGHDLTAPMANLLRPLAGGLAQPPSLAPAEATIGAGPDSLVLRISQDAWQGNAQFAVSVDGTPIGGAQTAQGLHAAGQVDTVTVRGDWAAGEHQLTVDFLNDAYAGGALDRNLYVEGAVYNGTAVIPAAQPLYWEGTTIGFIDPSPLG